MLRKKWIIKYLILCAVIYGVKGCANKTLSIYQEKAVINHSTADKELKKDLAEWIKFLI